MQKWEYLFVYKTRGWQDSPPGKVWHQSGPWENFVWSTKEKGKKWDGEFNVLLNQLGEEGWELVSVSPRSETLGAAAAIHGGFLAGSGEINGMSLDMAGFTDGEVWVFKRPKS